MSKNSIKHFNGTLCEVVDGFKSWFTECNKFVIILNICINSVDNIITGQPETNLLVTYRETKEQNNLSVFCTVENPKNLQSKIDSWLIGEKKRIVSVYQNEVFNFQRKEILVAILIIYQENKGTNWRSSVENHYNETSLWHFDFYDYHPDFAIQSACEYFENRQQRFHSTFTFLSKIHSFS